MPPRKPKSTSTPKPSTPATLPPPFKPLPASLHPFTAHLSKRHIYLTHIDTSPRLFKLKIFLVPVAMNLAVVALFLWRVNYILPWYGALLLSTLGYTRDDEAVLGSPASTALALVILRRAVTFLIDFLLTIFVWPWPVEFAFGVKHSNPVVWRWKTGFRDKEVYVRRSREWDRDVLEEAMTPEGVEKRRLIILKGTKATDPLLLKEKTGYLLMNADWDLDWRGMVDATRLVDKKDVALGEFERVVVFWSKEFAGWVCLDRQQMGEPGAGGGAGAAEDERRRQVLAFRDALAAVGKEDMFYRWIEIVQFEVSQPGGFGEEKQVEVAGRIREMFAAEGIDFDRFWREAVGSDTSEGLAGMM